MVRPIYRRLGATADRLLSSYGHEATRVRYRKGGKGVATMVAGRSNGSIGYYEGIFGSMAGSVLPCETTIAAVTFHGLGGVRYGFRGDVTDSAGLAEYFIDDVSIGFPVNAVFDGVITTVSIVSDFEFQDGETYKLTTSLSLDEFTPAPMIREEYPFTCITFGVDGKLVDGTSIIYTDQLMYVSNKYEIELGDTVIVNGKEYTVHLERPVPSSGDLTLQEFILR